MQLLTTALRLAARFLLLLSLLVLSARQLSALIVTFPARPVVGAPFEAVLDSEGDVACDNDLTKTLVRFEGSGRRVVTLGDVPDIGFYRLTFSDLVTGEEQVAMISVLETFRVSVKPVSPTLATLEKTVAMAHTPLIKWQALMPVWRTVQCRMSELSRQDQIDVERLYSRYFGSTALGTEQLFGTERAVIARDLLRSLRTELGSLDGRRVRYELNRSLSATDSTDDARLMQRTSGALALTMGTDAAIGSGANTEGKLLLKLAAETTDSIVAGLNSSPTSDNFTSLLYGMATGYGPAGDSMPAADFLLRGTSLVLGALPPDRRSIRLGNEVIDQAFSCGCNLSRQFRLYNQFQPFLPTNPSLLHKCVEGLGYWLPPDINRQLGAVNVAHTMAEIVQADLALLKNVHAKHAYTGSVFGLLVYPKAYSRNTASTKPDVANRAPDIFLAEKTLLRKIDNSGSLSLTMEIKNFLHRVETEDLTLNIYIKSSTVLTPALVDKLSAIDALVFDINEDGNITLRKLQP